MSGSEHPLHLDDVEPTVELPPDLSLDPDEVEAAGSVQRDRGLMASDDAGDHRMEAALASEPDELGDDDSTHSEAATGLVHVDGVLHGRGVGRSFLERRQ